MHENTKLKLKEVNKNRPIHLNPMYKPILNLETGIYYDTIQEAAFSINWGNSKLGHYLRGRYINKTNLIFTYDE